MTYDNVYLTAGRDYNAHGCYEYVLGGYTSKPKLFNDGSPIPVIIARQSGFRSKAQARSSGLKKAKELGL